ncbi:MAG: restriction endonuclease subunit S [Chitinophagaceae bacterium]|nr:restriction endonuclease subunit S [Chitinophagaceae bacterium]
MTEEKEINQLPKDWKWVKLGEVCNKISLNKIKIKQKEYLEVGDYPVVDQGQDLIGGYFNDKSLIVPEEPPYIIFGDHTKVKKFINFNFIAGADGVKVLKAKDVIDSKFLYFSLFKIKIEDKGYARHFQLLEKELFPLPPKPTQLAIVSKIEELFSEIENGIKSLLTAKEQLKKYRQSVLKWAFENNTFKDFILKDVTEKIQIGPFGSQLHEEDYIENGIPLINPTHIKNGLIVADNSFSILKSKRDSLPNYILKAGDVIMGRRGEMGRCGLVTNKEAGWFCGTGSLYFRPNTKKVNPVFLYYYLRSEPVKKYLDENAGGTTMANLNLKIVNDIPISLPPIEEQNKIVRVIESRLSVADKMEESITESLQQAEALKQSILKEAFEGRLI